MIRCLSCQWRVVDLRTYQPQRIIVKNPVKTDHRPACRKTGTESRFAEEVIDRREARWGPTCRVKISRQHGGLRRIDVDCQVLCLTPAVTWHKPKVGVDQVQLSRTHFQLCGNSAAWFQSCQGYRVHLCHVNGFAHQKHVPMPAQSRVVGGHVNDCKPRAVKQLGG